MKRDYYEVLGIARTSSPEEIKRVYRQLAMQWHPDRVPAEKKKEAEERFKEISEAYAVLSDPQKREQYDRMGHAGIDGQYSYEDIFKGADFSSVFNDMNVGGDFFSHIFGDIFNRERSGSVSHVAKDLEYSFTVSLEEAFLGTKKSFDIRHQKLCPVCRGTGDKDRRMKKCPSCRGRGVVQQNQFFFTFSQACPSCQGTGEISSGNCPECAGKGRVIENENVTIKIPPGVDNGTVMRVRGKGNEAQPGRRGDLFVYIQVAPHAQFRREGKNIYSRLAVPYPVAVLGGEVSVPSLGGAKISMKIPPATQDGRIFRLKARGMMDVHSGSVGDHYVEIGIDIPQSPTPEQRKLIEDLRRVLER